MRIGVFATCLLIFGMGCAAPPPPVVAPAAPAPAPSPPPPPEVVWTARAGVAVHNGALSIPLARPFTRLEVSGVDSLGLLVTCRVCADTIKGWVASNDVLGRSAASPDAAAKDSLARFAFAVRQAAANHDIAALRPIMAPEFSFGLIGEPGPIPAMRAWMWENFRPLDQMTALLDRGLVLFNDSIWVAPPEFKTQLGYHGQRLGFRRGSDGRWQWLFLIGQ